MPGCGDEVLRRTGGEGYREGIGNYRGHHSPRLENSAGLALSAVEGTFRSMSSPDWPYVERVLATVIDLPKDERSARIAHLCPNNPSLRAEVESLLAAHESAESFMQTRSLLQSDSFRLAVADDVDASHVAGDGVASLRPEMKGALPARIGHYRIIRQLAEGGMG